MAYHVTMKGCRHMIRSFDESQGPSHLHGDNPWLVCEVAPEPHSGKLRSCPSAKFSSDEPHNQAHPLHL